MLRKWSFVFIVTMAAITVLLIAAIYGPAQEKTGRETYQATAMGQSTQLGSTFSINLIIEKYSAPEDRQVLVDAFNKSGSEGLFNALEKMKPVGRMAITGTLGFDVAFARKIPTENGTKIRVLTSRPISFMEARNNTRSGDYDLTVLELDLSKEKGKSTGVLLPAAKLKVDKKTNELEIEVYQNPWKLVNILDRNEEK